MQLQERIANLEKELADLKLEVIKDQDIPNIGEIVEMGDDIEEDWLLRRFCGFAVDSGLPMDEFGESFCYYRRLSDPMVVQLKPYDPQKDDTPDIAGAWVLVVYENGQYHYTSDPHILDWGDQNPRGFNIKGWVVL